MGWETESEAPTYLGTLADLLRSKLTEGPKPFSQPTPEQIEKELGDASNFVTPMAGPAALGIILGKGAKTAIPELADLVATMLRNGRGADEAYAASLARGQGWYKGPDGKMRFEVPDDKVRLHPFAERDLRKSISGVDEEVSSLISHPELFKAHPDLADYKVVGQIDPNMKDVIGSFHGDMGTIEVFARNRDDWIRTLLHELQHGGQRIEGFDPGANSGDIQAALVEMLRKEGRPIGSKVKDDALELYFNNMGEAESRMVENRWFNKIPNYISPQNPAGGYDRMWADLIKYGDLPKLGRGDAAKESILYHGSPYKWDKPDPSKVLTGEGMASEGAGLYASEDPYRAMWYARTLAQESGNPAYLYKLAFPDEQYAKMIDLNKKVAEHPEEIIRTMRKISPEHTNNALNNGQITDFWADLAEESLGGTASRYESSLALPNLTKALAEKGVPGFKYSDPVWDYSEATSLPRWKDPTRHMSDNASNTVIFPEYYDLIELLRRK